MAFAFQRVALTVVPLLLGGRVCRRRQIISIPRVRARVSEHVVLERTCRKCGQRWSPEPDFSRLRGGALGFSLYFSTCRRTNAATALLSLAPEVRYFLRRGSRGSKVVEEVLGDEFDGVLVSDFYGAYNVHQGLHQRCWTHLLRDIHQLKERFRVWPNGPNR